MIFRKGNVISDGKTGKRVPSGYNDWHSDMIMEQVPGDPCLPIILPKPQEPELDGFPHRPIPSGKAVIRTEEDWYRFLRSVFGAGR